MLGAYGVLLWLRFALLWVGIYVGLRMAGPEGVQAVQILVWPFTFLSTAFLDPATMPAGLGFLAAWNPVSATADSARALFGNVGVATGAWPTEHAGWLALLWPALLVLVFAPLAARRFRRLGA